MCGTYTNTQCTLSFNHTYTNPGDYTITAQSCNGCGAPSAWCRTDTFTVHVVDFPTGGAGSGGGSGGGSGSTGPDINPLRYDTLGELIDAIAYVLLFLSVILTPIAIVFGGFLMTTGIPSRQILGKKIIIYSLAIFFAIIITKWVTSLTKDIIG
mgnify:CR=1 FL=1